MHRSVCSWLCLSLVCTKTHDVWYKKQVYFPPGAIFKTLKSEFCVLFHIKERNVGNVENIVWFWVYFCNLQIDVTVDVTVI